MATDEMVIDEDETLIDEQDKLFTNKVKKQYPNAVGTAVLELRCGHTIVFVLTENPFSEVFLSDEMYGCNSCKEIVNLVMSRYYSELKDSALKKIRYISFDPCFVKLNEDAIYFIQQLEQFLLDKEERKRGRPE